jgi:hypothetical protein
MSKRLPPNTATSPISSENLPSAIAVASDENVQAAYRIFAGLQRKNADVEESLKQALAAVQVAARALGDKKAVIRDEFGSDDMSTLLKEHEKQYRNATDAVAHFLTLQRDFPDVFPHSAAYEIDMRMGVNGRMETLRRLQSHQGDLKKLEEDHKAAFHQHNKEAMKAQKSEAVCKAFSELAQKKSIPPST